MSVFKTQLRAKAFERALADAKAKRRQLTWEEFYQFMYGGDEWAVYCEAYASQFPTPITWREKQAERDAQNAAEALRMKHYGLN